VENLSSYVHDYLDQAARILRSIEVAPLVEMLKLLRGVRDSRGRLFVIGCGGGAANASHAVNDFRKIANIEAYTPVDNVAELTARTNDEGWSSVFSSWLQTSRLTERDVLLVLSVGGGREDLGISANIVEAIRHAKRCNASVIGIVGREGGFTAAAADVCIRVPVPEHASVTAHTESFQALLCHLLVSHPALQSSPMKWESLDSSPQMQSSGTAVKQ